VLIQITGKYKLIFGDIPNFDVYVQNTLWWYGVEDARSGILETINCMYHNNIMSVNGPN